MKRYFFLTLVALSLVQIHSGYAASSNLFLNPSLEAASTTEPSKPLGWGGYKWGTNTTTFTHLTTGGYDGVRAVQVNTTAYTSGDMKWLPNDVLVTPGKTYTFTHAYKSTIASSVDIRYTSTTGVVSYVSLVGTLPASTAWKTDSYNFTVPAGMKSLTIMHLIEGVGTLTVDNYSLIDPTATSTPDTTKPGVAITTPAASSTVSGNLTVIASSSDNVGVIGVKFYLDNVLLGFEDLTAPYQATWNTGSSTNAAHTLVAVARDAANNIATSTTVTVGVNNTVLPKNGTAVVQVLVINNNGGTKQISNFPIFLDGKSIVSGVTTTTQVGSHTVSYTADSQYTAVFSGGCSSSGVIIVAAGVTTTCTLTYDDITPISPTDPNNLILNPSFEVSTTLNGQVNPKNWSRAGFGNNTSMLSYPVPGETGGSATRVEMTVRKGGDVKWISDPINTVAGKRLRFSQRYRANVTTYVDVKYTHSNGSQTYQDIGVNIEAGGVWKTFEADLEVPQDVTSLQVMAILNKVGWLEVDSISLVERPKVVLSQGTLSLAFDDGYKSIYQKAIPILNARGIHSTQAIISDYFGGLYMTTQEMLAMQSAGHEIASHTRTHPHLPDITHAQAVDEIVNSKTKLLSLGVTRVDTLVYPYGEYNDSVEQIVRDAGYIGARTVNFGFNNKDTNKFELFDYHIEKDTTFASVKQLIDQAIANNTWVIFELHEQKADCADDQYCNTPAFLTQLADYIVQSGIQVVTVKEGVDLMNR